MSGKRKGPGTSEPYDTNKFKSPQAAKLFRDSMAKAAICRDRGVEYAENSVHYAAMTSSWISSVFEDRGWMRLTTPIEEGCANLVREFYANAIDPDSVITGERAYKSWVRGTEVDFSPKAIRRILSLPTTADVTRVFGQNGLDYHELLAAFPHEGLLEAIFGRPDATWILGTRKQPTEAIYRTDVKPKVRVWAFYFSDSAIPTLSKSELRKELLVFLYCIEKKLPIDLAQVISNRIYDIANVHKGERCLGYPMMINELLRARMQKKYPAVEVPIKPGKELTWKLIDHMLKEQESILQAPRAVRDRKSKDMARRPPPRSSVGTSADAPPVPPFAGAPSTEGPSTEAPAAPDAHTPPQSYENIPPMWAVNMQYENSRMHGVVLRRLADMHFNMQIIADTAGPQHPPLRPFAPYSAYEQSLVDASLLGDQEDQEVGAGADGGDHDRT